MNSGLCEHCLRVAYLVTDMTILLGMDEKATMDVQLAAIYHDIGKTQIPEQVLNKPGKLTPGEYFIMKLHAEIGYHMIQCHTSPETAQMVLYHHEDYDGGGYFGLQGNDIPYGARILRICDVYDALTSFRCYREPCSPEKALQYLKMNSKSPPDFFELFRMCKPIIPLFALHSSQTEKCGGTTKILNRYKKGMLRLLPSPKCIYEFWECKISLDLQYYIWWIFVRQNH